MSDQPTTTTASAQAGQPVQPVQPVGSLTPDELRQVTDNLFNRMRGYLDAKEARLGTQDQSAIKAPPPASESAETPAPAQGSGEDTDVVIKTLDAWVLQVESAANVELKKDDPEAELLDHSNPAAFQKSYISALKAKRIRTTPVPARTPTTAGQGAPPPKKTLMEEYLDEIKNVKPGGEQLMQIRRAYRQKGLDI